MSTTSSPPGDHPELTDAFITFYKTYYQDEIGELAAKYPRGQQSITIDYSDLYTYEPDLATDLRKSPEQVLEYAEEALRMYDLPVDVSLDGAHVHVENIGDAHTVDIGEVRNDDVTELLSVKGQVVRATDVRNKLTLAAYECQRCGTMTRIPQAREGEQEPHECKGCDRQGPFILHKGESEFSDNQLIRLQTPPQTAGGYSEETFDIVFENDLVKQITPGDRVRIPCIIRLKPANRNSDDGLYEPFGEAVGCVVEETDFEEIETKEFEDDIKRIGGENPYEMHVDSIAPSIHGLRDIKLAMSMQMHGGIKKERPDGSTERGDSHLALIGDPGTGKSELLNYAARMAPRSIFTDGKGSTAAGLTASAVRDEFGSGDQWTLKGGSLVVASGGICCIDELDDMSEDDRSSMNTALENQEISVAKAGINATLPAETTVLTAANPEYGRYDRYEPVSEQLDLDPALLSRFDLIFTLQDRPDEEKDRQVTRTKLKNAHVGQLNAADKKIPEEMLEETSPAMEPDLMRAYIAYTRKNIFPEYTSDAKELVEERFVEFRQKNNEKDLDPEEQAVPITYRKMEAITRLCEGSARMRLSETIEVEDVERVLSLIKKTLNDVGLDPESDEWDADIVETGTSHSQRDRVHTIKSIISEKDDKSNMRGVPLEEVMADALEAGIEDSRVNNELEKLKQKGEIYEPTTDHFRVS